LSTQPTWTTRRSLLEAPAQQGAGAADNEIIDAPRLNRNAPVVVFEPGQACLRKGEFIADCRNDPDGLDRLQLR
jgi:hypothetical protein